MKIVYLTSLQLPSERAYAIQIHAWQAENPQTKTLVVKNWPLGYVHTHDAYSDYISRYNKSSYELWQHILLSRPPSGIDPINVYYKHYDQPVTNDDMQAYDHIVVHHPPLVGEGMAPESPQDIFDVKPWTVWHFKEYQETYTVLK